MYLACMESLLKYVFGISICLFDLYISYSVFSLHFINFIVLNIMTFPSEHSGKFLNGDCDLGSG